MSPKLKWGDVPFGFKDGRVPIPLKPVRSSLLCMSSGETGNEDLKHDLSSTLPTVPPPAFASTSN